MLSLVPIPFTTLMTGNDDAGGAVYLSAVKSVENVVVILVPRLVIAGMIASAIPVAMIAYSIAVAAFSSFRNPIINPMPVCRYLQQVLQVPVLTPSLEPANRPGTAPDRYLTENALCNVDYRKRPWLPLRCTLIACVRPETKIFAFHQ